MVARKGGGNLLWINKSSRNHALRAGAFRGFALRGRGQFAMGRATPVGGNRDGEVRASRFDRFLAEKVNIYKDAVPALPRRGRCGRSLPQSAGTVAIATA